MAQSHSVEEQRRNQREKTRRMLEESPTSPRLHCEPFSASQSFGSFQLAAVSADNTENYDRSENAVCVLFLALY